MGKDLLKMESKWKNKNFFVALKNALNGIKYVFKTQRNIRIQLFFAIIVIVLGIILKCNYIEFAILVITIFGVFLAEFFNTAIESAIDGYTQEYNEKAKISKDVAAGAVTLVAVASVIIGLIIFLPKILNFL